MKRGIRRQVLDNRLTVVTEQVPAVRSASLGIWVKMGSRFELPAEAGISHFIEHMLFKGTGTRSARQIAFAIDAMGGQLDAFTTKEHACYYANVLDEHVEDAFALLSDIVLDPVFEAQEVERERDVILEELAAVEDSPEDLLWEEFASSFWPDHPLGAPILGTRETIESFTRPQLSAFFQRAYEPANVVVAASGHLCHRQVLEAAVNLFGQLDNRGEPPRLVAPVHRQHLRIRRKQQLEQVHIAVGCPAPAAAADERYTAFVLNAVLGGSVSSRLFQRIREEQGLAYNVYSSLETYTDAGCFWIYAATRADAAATVLDLIVAELRLLRERSVPADELHRMKENLKGNLMLGLESTVGRMSALAQQEMYFGRTFDMDEILAGIEAVSSENVRKLACSVFADDGIAVDVLTRARTADELGLRLVDGLVLPGGGRLSPA